jgi:cytochrome c
MKKVLLRYMPVALAVMAIGTAVQSPAQTGDAAAGAQVFATCRSCHTLGTGERNGIGPNLHGLFGRQAGSAPGYNYSAALKAANVRWDAKALDTFLTAPSKMVPGTRMVMHVNDPARRAALLAYLKAETSK